jgi:DNA-binding CsgD family transcriptional regulator
MEHVRILIALLSVLFGAYVTFYAARMHASLGLSFVRAVAMYMGALNAGVLLLLLAKYIEINLPEIRAIEGNRTYVLLMRLAVTGVLYWLLLTFLVLIRELLGKQWLLARNWVLWLIPAAIAFSYIILLLGPTNDLVRVLGVVTGFIYDNAIILEIPMALTLLGAARAVPNKGGRRIAANFAIITLCRYLIILGAAVLWDTVGYYGGFVGGVVMLFSVNALPLAWLRWIVTPEVASMLTVKFDGERLDIIQKRFGISGREREIMELLLQGRSNKEIADALFISLRTVKNHIYNFYQKLGIHSRYQLVSMVLGTKDAMNQDGSSLV